MGFLRLSTFDKWSSITIYLISTYYAYVCFNATQGVIKLLFSVLAISLRLCCDSNGGIYEETSSWLERSQLRVGPDNSNR